VRVILHKQFQTYETLFREQRIIVNQQGTIETNVKHLSRVQYLLIALHNVIEYYLGYLRGSKGTTTTFVFQIGILGKLD
jgi:hypothetical protein